VAARDGRHRQRLVATRKDGRPRDLAIVLLIQAASRKESSAAGRHAVVIRPCDMASGMAVEGRNSGCLKALPAVHERAGRAFMERKFRKGTVRGAQVTESARRKENRIHVEEGWRRRRRKEGGEERRE